MHLAGQHERRARPDAGYAMAVLLAGIAIMGIVWTLVVPVWKQSVQREKEAELIFRAGQYARGVALYQRKYANAFPPNVDVLLREKFLRKKYKDPVTNGDFRFLSPLELQSQPGLTSATPFSNVPGLNRQPGGGTGSPGGGSGSPGGGSGSPGGGSGSTFGSSGGSSPNGPGPTPSPGGLGSPSRFGANGPGGGPSGGIAAVVSKSTGASIKVFKNRRQYNQWIVTVQDVMPRSAVGMQPGQQPGQPGLGGPGTSPGSTSPGLPSRRSP
jgi:type II secretory pathway pseudopilin PulG